VDLRGRSARCRRDREVQQVREVRRDRPEEPGLLALHEELAGDALDVELAAVLDVRDALIVILDTRIHLIDALGLVRTTPDQRDQPQRTSHAPIVRNAARFRARGAVFLTPRIEERTGKADDRAGRCSTRPPAWWRTVGDRRESQGRPR
jgi:hypothetical protein